MAAKAIWTWYNPWQAVSERSDAGGWEIEQHNLINSPESLQRVIAKVELTGYDAALINTTNGGFGAGLIVFRIGLNSSTVNRSLALVSRGCWQSFTQAGPTDGISLWTNVYATHSPIELDITVRQAPNVPPAPALDLYWTLSYGKFGGPNNPLLNPVTWWAGNVDFMYLTSQPGPTTP